MKNRVLTLSIAALMVNSPMQIAFAGFEVIAPSATQDRAITVGASDQRVGQYNFSYLTSGELSATPVQVFDDGKSTFFQFRAGGAIPAVFGNKDGKTVLLVPIPEGPYTRVNGVGSRFTLQLGRAQAQVVYSAGGQSGVPATNAAASNGASTAFQEGGGYLADSNIKLIAPFGPAMNHVRSDVRPIEVNKVSLKKSETKTSEYQVWFSSGSPVLKPAAIKQLLSLAAILKNAIHVTVVGRDDDTFKEGLEQARANAIRNLLVKVGVPSERITLKTGVQGEAQKGMWASDIRVETVIPTQIARPSESPPNTSTAPDRNAYVKSNLEGLVLAGVITREQAQAMLQRYGEQAPPDRPREQVVQVQQPSQAIRTDERLNWEILAKDGTLQNTLARWAKAANWDVHWENVPEIRNPGYVNLPERDFLNAAEYVLAKAKTAAKASGIEISITAYTNRVLVISVISKEVQK